MPDDQELNLDAFLALPREEQDRLMTAAAEDAAPLYADDLALPPAERELRAFTALDGAPFVLTGKERSIIATIAHEGHLTE